MLNRLSLVKCTLFISLLMMNGIVRSEQNKDVYLAENSALENTERNVRDQGQTNLTPADQLETKEDIAITAAIRQVVVRDESLSLNAQNVKIITRHGVVTLRGPVESEAERLKLQQIATQTPGVVQVENQLEYKTP